MAERRVAAAAITVLILLDDDDDTKKRGKTRSWIKRRKQKGAFSNIVQELRMEDTDGFKEMMRMEYDTFLKLLNYVEPFISPQERYHRAAVINAKERLTLTLRFLATGETYKSLGFQFRISCSAISYIVSSVCEALIAHVGKEYLKTPSTKDEWALISHDFQEKWQFPNALGAIDGKHIVIIPPPNSGSNYYNYKHTNSIVLLAIAGPNYECLFADVGTNGRMNDSGIWNKSSLRCAIESREIEFPEPKTLPYRSEKLPFVIVGDDAFALKNYMMKPFPQRNLTVERRIYNYRHSRARRISENMFGILANRLRIFHTTMHLSPERATSITLSALVLHNFLLKSQSKSVYCAPGLIDQEDTQGNVVAGSWRTENTAEGFRELPPQSHGNNVSSTAKNVREGFMDYVMNEGALSWQWDKC